MLKIQRPRIILFLSGMIVAILAALIFGWYQSSQWQEFVHANPNISLDYHQIFEMQNLPAEQINPDLKFVFQARETDEEKPVTIDLRVETGLRIAVSLTKQEMIPMLLGNSEKSFPSKFPNYTKVAERQFEQAGKKAAELIFTYTGPSGQKVTQRLLLVAYDGNTALYLAAQARETDFSDLNKRYFDRMFASLKFD